MAAASFAACGVLSHVILWIAVCSMCLNFAWRGHDFACVVVLMAAAVVWREREWIWGGLWEGLHEIGRQRAGA